MPSVITASPSRTVAGQAGNVIATPADGHRRDEAHPDPAEQPAADQRDRVVAHRTAAHARREDLGHVRNADRQQARHACSLQRRDHEQRGEARRHRGAQARQHQQAAREHQRALATNALRHRAPEPARERDGEHDHRDRQPGLRRCDLEVDGQLGQDRPAGVHRREHAGRAQQQPAHIGRAHGYALGDHVSGQRRRIDDLRDRRREIVEHAVEPVARERVQLAPQPRRVHRPRR